MSRFSLLASAIASLPSKAARLLDAALTSVEASVAGLSADGVFVMSSPAVGNVVCGTTADHMALADADDAAKVPAIGVVAAVVDATHAQVRFCGIVEDAGTFTAWAIQYLDTTAGALVETAPATPYVYPVGIAINTTDLLVLPVGLLTYLLKSVLAKFGASMIGIVDVGTLITGVNVETALQELAQFKADLGSTANGKGASKIAIEDAGALYAAGDSEAAFLEVKTKAAVHQVRGVSVTNVANLAAFVVANNGITYIQGDRILLAAQSTGAQNGIYVVGAVSGTAPLTRAADMPTGLALPLGTIVETGPEGTEYKSSSWKATATTTGGAVIGTNDPLFYPRVYKQTVTLASGTYTIGFGSTATPDEALFLKSTTESMVNITRDTAGGTLTGTVTYVAPVTNRVAGGPGTAVVVVRSAVEAGTIQNQDNSTLSVLITNW